MLFRRKKNRKVWITVVQSCLLQEKKTSNILIRSSIISILKFRYKLELEFPNMQSISNIYAKKAKTVQRFIPCVGFILIRFSFMQICEILYVDILLGIFFSKFTQILAKKNNFQNITFRENQNFIWILYMQIIIISEKLHKARCCYPWSVSHTVVAFVVPPLH